MVTLLEHTQLTVYFQAPRLACRGVLTNPNGPANTRLGLIGIDSGRLEQLLSEDRGGMNIWHPGVLQTIVKLLACRRRGKKADIKQSNV
jgi:hypothetical protein